MHAFIFLALLAFFIGSSSKIALAVNANIMAFKSNGETHDGNGWVLLNNGYVGTFINVDYAGPVTITIQADGSIAEGTLPIMHLHIGDNNEAWSVTDNGYPHTTYSDYVANFNLPDGMHMVRIEFVNDYTVSGNRDLYIKSVTFVGATLENDATTENALAAADNYIDKYQKGLATVNAPDDNILEGTSVQVKLDRHAFNFGTAVYGNDNRPAWTYPNPAPGSDNYKYQQFLNSHFNMIVPENSGKWWYNELSRDVVKMTAVDAMLDYAEAHNLRARMHCAFWDDQQPGWVDTLKNQALTDPDAALAYWDEMMERIEYYIADRTHRLTDIDGINESCNRDMHTQIYSIEGVADIYNEMVAAAAGQAKIAVNEYGVLEWGGYGNWYREHIEDITNAGGTVELIGIQNHTATYAYDGVGVFQNLQLFAGFELPIIITEFSLYDAPSSSILNETMRLVFGNDMTNGFTTWGFWEGNMWRPNSALVDQNWYLTPMGTAYEQLMAQWDTDEVVYVDSNSQIQFTGFYGDYTLTIEGQSYSITFNKGTGVTEPIVRILYVDDDAPGDPAAGDPDTSDPNEDGSLEHPFDAIQEAIDVAAYRHTIAILDGTYTGEGNRDIYYKGKELVIKSKNGPDACIIDCQSTYSGFLFANGESSNAVLEGLTIINGRTYDEYGGAIACYGGSSPTINNCTLIGNGSIFTGFGGAIGCLTDSNPTITNCRIIGNSSVFGGAIYCEEGSPIIRNCILTDNSAEAWGGGICSYLGNPTIQNCTFSNNTADSGGGLYTEGGTATFTNCILWADTANTGSELMLTSLATVIVSYSDVKGGESAAEVESGSTLVWDPNNIESDPNFVYASHPDPNQRDYHLLPESPCINAGDPAGSYTDQTDIDENPRVIDGRIDIGTDEFTCVGDLDYNGTVNLSDLPMFGAYWQETGCYLGVECIKADLNRDTEVNWGDLKLYVQNWLVTVEE